MEDEFRTLRWAAWLGWNIESNWTDPARFAVYLLIKPFAGSLLLVCMYWAAQQATGGTVPAGLLPFMYVGNACFMLVGTVTFGMSWAVIADREHYGMLGYIRISPARLETYLIGRGLAKGAEGAVGAILTVVIGWLLLPEMRAGVRVQEIEWLWLAAYGALGLILLLGLGLILAGSVLNTARNGMFLSEGVAGTLYLLTGAVFPIGVLPAWLQGISLLLPPTYWLEGMRRALVGKETMGTVSSPLLAWDSFDLVLALAGSTVILASLGHLIFMRCERRAWRLGRFDQRTG